MTEFLLFYEKAIFMHVSNLDLRRNGKTKTGWPVDHTVCLRLTAALFLTLDLCYSLSNAFSPNCIC